MGPYQYLPSIGPRSIDFNLAGQPQAIAFSQSQTIVTSPSPATVQVWSSTAEGVPTTTAHVPQGVPTATASVPQQISFQTATQVPTGSRGQLGLLDAEPGLVGTTVLSVQEFSTYETSHRNRSRLEIYASILIATTFDSLTVSQVALLLRMNFKQTKGFLDLLTMKGLLQTQSGSPIRYRTTENGVKFSNHVKSALRMLN